MATKGLPLSPSLHLATLQSVIDALPFYALLVDARHEIVAANSALCAAYSVTPAQLVGSFCPRAIHGLDGPFPGCPLEEAARTGHAVERELYDDKTGAWYASAMYPVGSLAGEERTVFMHWVRDITLAKTSEEALQRSLGQHKVITSILRAAQGVRTATDLLEGILDRVSALESLGLDDTALAFVVEGENLRRVASRKLSKDVRASCGDVAFGHCLCGRVAASGEPVFTDRLTADHEVRSPDMGEHGHAIIPLKRAGRVAAVLNFYRPSGAELPEDSKEFFHAVASIGSSVLERLDLEAGLAHADRLRSIGTLATGIAHEISNPLTYLLNNLHILNEDASHTGHALRNLASAAAQGLPLQADAVRGLQEALARQADTQEMLAEAVEGANRVQVIASDVKKLARMEDRRLEPVDVCATIDSAANMARAEIQLKAQLVKDFQAVPLVLASEGRLTQVFLNLLVNAAQAIADDAAPDNLIRVEVRCEGAVVTAEVSDTGRGIREEDLPRLFEPFFTTKAARGGTGLGLSICNDIIRGWGGDISVESAPGAGSMFRVALPVASVPGTTGERAACKPLSSRPARARGHVLILEPDHAQQPTLCRLIESEHDFLATTTAQEAIDAVTRAEPFDAVLCSWTGEHSEGAALLAWLAENAPGLEQRSVLIHNDASTTKQGEGVSDLSLVKPLDPIILRQILRALVGSKRPRR